MMNSKLTGVTIAAAIVATNSLVMAQQATDTAPDQAAKQNQTTEKTTKKTTTTTTTTKKKAKDGAADTKTHSTTKTNTPSSTPSSTSTSNGSVKETVEGAAKDSSTAAAEVNEDIVGKTTQQKNEMRARDPKLRDAQRQEQSAQKTGEAVGRATTTAATAVADTTADVTRATDRPGAYRPFAVELNPLGLVVGGRISLGFEFAPVTHHVIIFSPHYVRTTADIDVSANRQVSQSFTGGGAELGYRYYTGNRGMNGVFIGPSIIGGVFNAGLPGEDKTFTSFGGAVDVGVQTIVFDHLVLGAGVGVQYLHVSEDFGDLPAGPSTIASTGFKPRLLAQAGYAF